MKKMKGKRLLSLLLTLCMVLSLVPTALAAEVRDAANAVVGDTITTDTDEAPSATSPAYWEKEAKVVCGKREHTHDEDCYYQSCDHAGGHLSTCYGNEYTYELCEHDDDSQHTGTGDLADVVTIDGTNVSWKTEHPAYPAIRKVYDDAYTEAYNNEYQKDTYKETYDATYKTTYDGLKNIPTFVMSEGQKVAAAKEAAEAAAKLALDNKETVCDTAGKVVAVAALEGKTFCFTTSPSAIPDNCTHTCSALGGECYTKTCIRSEHRHVADCYDYVWTLCSNAEATIDVESIARLKMEGIPDTDKAAILNVVKNATTVRPAGAEVTYAVADYDTPADGEETLVEVTIKVAPTSTTKETTKTVNVTIYSELDRNKVTVVPADFGTVTVTNGTSETAEGATGEYVETTLTVVADPDSDCYVADVKVGDTSILNDITDETFTKTFEVAADTTVTVEFAKKEATEICLYEGFDPVTYGQFKDGDVLAQLVAGVYAGDEKIGNSDDVTFKKSPATMNAGEQEVTLVYDGDVTHLSSKATTTITIEKAPATVNVNNVTVRYGEDYDLAISAKSESGEDIPVISFVAGLDMEDMQIVNGQVTFPETVVTVNVPPIEIFGRPVELPSANLSLTEAIKIIEEYIPASEYITEEQIDQLISALEELQEKFGEVTVRFNGDMPEDVGVYLVGAVAADSNYETAMGVGSLVITPDGHKADLDWNIHDENGAIALTAIDTYDLGAHVAKLYEVPSGMTEAEAIAEAESEMELLFIGMNLDGEIVMTQDLKAEDKLTGAYAEVACIVNWGNEMYYSEPIVRTLVVVPELVDVKFVDANENNARLFTYTGDPCEMEVLVEGVVTEPGDNLTVVYAGVTVDGETYYSEEAPSEVGAYTATALYSEKENGEVVKAGIAIGAMVIEKQESGFAMYNETVTYDGQEHFVEVEGADNTAILYAVVNRDTNTVNVIVPEELKALVPELAQSGSVDITAAKDVIETLIAKVKAVELPEGFEIPEGFVAELNKVLVEVEAVLAEVPDATVMINGEDPVDAGVYEVHAVTYSKTMKSVYADATLTIEKCPVTITVADAEVVVGEDAPQFTYTVSGIVGEYDPNVMLNCEYDKATATAGQEYAITATFVADDNYAVTVVPGKLTVKERPVVTVPVTGVTLDKTSATIDLKYSNTTTLAATVSPADATNKAVTWTSSNPSVATVDANGVVTAITTGTATITVTTDDGGYTATCDITVTRSRSGGGGGGGGGSTKYAITVEDTENGVLELSHSKASAGTTVTITVNPEAGYAADSITVTTSKGKVVEVKDLGNGKYTFTMPSSKVVVDGNFVLSGEGTVAEQEVIILTIDSVIAWVFDEYVVNDVAPVIRNERTMLPARFVAEALGGVVTWDAETQKVTIVKGEATIEIFIGEPFALVNNVPVELDSPAFIENSRTYLPLRFIAENLGATVIWDGVKQTVTIIPSE